MKHVINPGDKYGRLTVIAEVQKTAADGLTYRQLAAEFGISDMSACAAVNRKTWAHVS